MVFKEEESTNKKEPEDKSEIDITKENASESTKVNPNKFDVI